MQQACCHEDFASCPTRDDVDAMRVWYLNWCTCIRTHEKVSCTTWPNECVGGLLQAHSDQDNWPWQGIHLRTTRPPEYDGWAVPYLKVVSIPERILRVTSKRDRIIGDAGNLTPDAVQIGYGPSKLYIFLNLLLRNIAHSRVLRNCKLLDAKDVKSRAWITNLCSASVSLRCR